MAKDTQRRSFSVFRSDAIDENERILEAGRQQRQENRKKKESGEDTASVAPAPSADAPVADKSASSATTKSEAETPTTTTTTPVAETPATATTTPVAETPTPTSFSNDIAMNMRKPKGKKTENGITIYVPMEYYERIALMKMRTGVPIKDLALQAVIEFLDRNKM